MSSLEKFNMRYIIFTFRNDSLVSHETIRFLFFPCVFILKKCGLFKVNTSVDLVNPTENAKGNLKVTSIITDKHW